MSIKKDPSGCRSVQVEVEVPGTPEEVWQAIASGPGISSWFVPTRSEERAGGEVVSTFGPGMDCPATITAWEAPKRFVVEGTMGPPDSPKVATEWSVEARAGGVCVVRVVHSLFASSDDWDGQLTGLEQGWPTYFRILRLYLERHKGLSCSAMHFVAFSSETESAAWEKAGGELALLGLSLGQRWSAPRGFPALGGVVDRLGHGMHSNTILLRVDDPAPGSAYLGAFSCGGMVMVCMSVYLYGEQAAAIAAEETPRWDAWFQRQFPAAAAHADGN